MIKQQKLQLLNKLLKKSEEITTTSCADPIFKDWKILVERSLIKIFGVESIEVKEFKKLKFYFPTIQFSIVNENAMQHIASYKRDFETALKSINQYLEETQEEPENESSIPIANVELKEIDEKKELPQIEWKGTQKELGELFIELKRKGWIDEINADLIHDYFSESNTIKQVLKPNKDKQGNANYDAVYTKAYKPKFDLIRMREIKK